MSSGSGRRRQGAAVLGLSIPLLISHVGAASRQQNHDHSTTAASKDELTRVSVPDVVVVTHEGSQRRFYTDLVKNKVVVINFIFTTCTTICPPLGATFSKLQGIMGDRVGRDLFLISVSVDPVTDTPERLRAWAAQFRAGPGWTLVTGSKPEIDRLLKALGGFSAQKQDHTPMVLIGDEARGVWQRAYGLAPPGKLVEVLERVTAARAGAGKGGLLLLAPHQPRFQGTFSWFENATG